MNTTEAIRARRSVRKFKPAAEISPKQVELMLEAAMMAPSAKNQRPWEFVVVRDRKKIDAFADAHPFAKMLFCAPLAIVVMGLPEVNADCFPLDCGAAVQNILLQAATLGLGTCWISAYPYPERMDFARKSFGIEGTPFCVIAVGVPDEAPKAKGFFDPEKVKYI